MSDPYPLSIEARVHQNGGGQAWRTKPRDEPIGLRKELQIAPGNVFLRCLTARAIAALTRERPEEIAAQRWSSHKVLLEILTRAASAPAQIGVTGWAAELIRLVVMDSLEALGPASAGARLLKSCTVLTFDEGGLISAPGFVASAANAGFVGDGSPIPVRQLSDSTVQLQPHKLGVISVLTNEMILSSNAEALIGDTLLRSAAAALDLSLFDTNAATAVRPAGLRQGIAALTASSNTDAWTAYFEDAATLINAVATVGGKGPFAMIATPGRVTEMTLRSWGGDDAPFELLSSSQLGADIMIAVAPDAVVAAIAPEPEIDVSTATALHMNDTPLAIVNGGAPAAPAKAMFQTDSVALKLRWPVTWALRDPRGVAWLTPAWK
jgi:hypothetical protein